MKTLYRQIMPLLLLSVSWASAANPSLTSGLSLLNLASNSASASSEPDYTWLRLFGMWHDQLTPSGYAIGAGAKIDPSPKVSLAIDAELRLQRENLSGNSTEIGNDMGLVFPVTLQYTLLGDHRSILQPYVAGGAYYTTSTRGGSEIGWLAVGGLALRLGTEVIALDTRYYSDTYVTDSPDTHHYAARLTLWFLKPDAKPASRTGSPARSPSQRPTAGSTDKSTGGTGTTGTDSRSGKKRY